MSTLHPPAVGEPSAAMTRRAAASPALETVTIQWSLSRRAVCESKGRPGNFALVDRGEDLLLRWSLELEGEARAVLVDPANGSEAVMSRGACTHLRDGDLLHVEVRDGPDVLLAATLRLGGDSARVLYARTSVLAAMGLGGGRYEVA